MKLSPSTVASLHDALNKIVTLSTGEEDQWLSTDFYFMPDRDNGHLLITDDNDTEIAQAQIPEWAGYTGDDFYTKAEAALLEAIKEANKEGELERLAVWMPYSFVLVDEDRESICDLLLVDDDTLVVTDSLLKGLDTELNEFIEKLLKE